MAGRVDHVKIGDQFGADPKRVEYYQKQLEHINVEMEPGDAVFFHSKYPPTYTLSNFEIICDAYLILILQNSKVKLYLFAYVLKLFRGK